MERTSVEYPNMLASGTSAVIACAEPRASIPDTRPRRADRLPVTSPMNSSGVSTSTCITGSSSTGPASRAAAVAPIEPAIWNAISLESTSW